METRIDRIERYIEEFSKGMPELKEAQKKTDAQQYRTDAQKRPPAPRHPSDNCPEIVVHYTMKNVRT